MSNLSLFHSNRPADVATNEDEVKAAFEVASHLIGDTAHDLRAPLSTARELAQLVANGDAGAVTDDQRDHLNAVVQRCNDMHRLIDDMLQFEGVNNGVPRTYRCWLPPCQFPTAVEALVRNSLDARSIRLNWLGFESSQPSMFGDFDKLKRLLVNLICNANQVTPEGGAIDVVNELVDADSKTRLTVVDRGPGMDDEEIRRLTTRGISQSGGQGLGLAICRQVAALHFTRVTMESHQGQGSRFSIELPIGGPAAVIDSFASWRESLLPDGYAKSRGSRMRPSRRPQPGTTRRALLSDQAAPEYPCHVTMVSANAVGKLDHDAAIEMDHFLQSQCRLHELAYRVEQEQWIMLLDVSIGQADERIRQIVDTQKRIPETSINRHEVEWCGPVALAIGAPRDRQRLQEAFVRGSLGIGRPRPQDPETPGSPQDSDRASRRLDAEVRWITDRFKNRQQRLRDQANSVRLPWL